MTLTLPPLASAEVAATALARLPGATPARLGALLDHAGGDALQAWEQLTSGRPAPAGVDDDVWLVWRRAAAPDALALAGASLRHAAASALVPADARYPARLRDDHRRPAVLFSRGDPTVAARPCVGIVGTRRCTPYGRSVARRLGSGLAASGVAVVSGLAAGVDGAAHEGALHADAAPPIGVVGSGLDVVYPRRHAALWWAVGERGWLVSEAPPGALPEPWRFPARNRILAALSHVVVVVESHVTGGSMHTVDAAAERSVPVLAVPGPVGSSASAGTNQLLADGCAPARDVDDVLAALSLVVPVPRTDAPGSPERRPPPTGADAAVLEAVGWTATSFDDVLETTGLGAGAAAAALDRLAAAGWIDEERGAWLRT